MPDKYTEMNLTVASLSQKGDFIKLGETDDPKAAGWYKLGPKVQAFVNKNYKKGDKVTFSYSKVGKDNVIAFIKKFDGNSISSNTRVPRKTAETGATPNRFRTEDNGMQMSIQKSITQQKALDCATQAVRVLEGQLTTPAEVTEAVKEIYKGIYPLIEFELQHAPAQASESASGPEEVTVDDGPQEA